MNTVAMDPMLTWMQVFALVAAGVVFALLGSIKIPLARQLNIDEAKIGGLVSVFGFTWIPMVFAAGVLADIVGKQAVLGAGFVLVIISLLMLANMKSYGAVLFAVLALGTGWSAQVNVLNVTTPPAFLPEHEILTRMAFAMNLGDFIFGVGTFITPMIVVVLIRKIGLVRTFYGLILVAIIPVLLGAAVDWDAKTLNPEVTQTVVGGLGTLMTDSVVWICCIAFFFHVPIEISLATWATTLVMDKGVSEAAASTLLSVFWLTFLASRLITALCLPEGYDTTLVIAMAGLCIAFTGGIVLSRSAQLTCTLVVLAGAILGPIFPTLIAILLTHVDEGLRARAVGIFFSIGGIGCTTVPILIGLYAKKTSVQQGFLIAMISAMALCLFAILLMINLSH